MKRFLATVRQADRLGTVMCILPGRVSVHTLHKGVFPSPAHLSGFRVERGALGHALSPASHNYGPTSFGSGRPVVVYGLLESGIHTEVRIFIAACRCHCQRKRSLTSLEGFAGIVHVFRSLAIV